MSSPVIRQLAGRLSLRSPQVRSLEILETMLQAMPVAGGADLVARLAVVREHFASVEDFERDFPSLCFALATGVGKTRLMGAFIAYLYLTNRSRHFFVLAPNLTIYEKLKSDFSPASPKYVFKGIPELALNQPLLITGENFETGLAVRREDVAPMTVAGQLFGAELVPQINIFNVSKINSEERAGSKSRMKRLQEYIGQSYFEYLAELDDLVVLMDEAHRYRATAGARAINDLKPILGLELTATPKTVGARPVDFRNVIYRYPLAEAMRDGLVKEPAVATRKDFDARGLDENELERIKLEDGIHHHEYVKIELETYALQTGQSRIKPFVLVVAQDTTHAGRIKARIEDETFFGGAYRGKVIEVHSALRGEESDDAMQRLLAVESDARTEIVIHVNKLKEGWDVTNLYTIVPLRASASEILTEQTIGRGLRLPFGQRTGIKALDRLTIVAHDRFQEIIDQANAPGSIIRERVLIGAGGDVPAARPQLVETPSVADYALTGRGPSLAGAPLLDSMREPPAEYRLVTPEQQELARQALAIVQRRHERLARPEELRAPEISQQIVAELRATATPTQLVLLPQQQPEMFETVVATVIAAVIDLGIAIPNVVVLPTREVTFGFDDFDLAHLDRIGYQPVEEALLIQQLRDREQDSVGWTQAVAREPRLENYLVRGLMDRDEVDYEAHAGLLEKLAGQLIARLRVHLQGDDAAVENVLIYYQRPLVDFIWAQMQQHTWETPSDYVGRITRGFTLLRPLAFSLPAGERPRDFRVSLEAGVSIRGLAFCGFHKCCYPLQQFQSAEGELRLAQVLEDDPAVLRWLKPAPGQFQIEWQHGRGYEPDFVAETTDAKLILEPKRRSELEDAEVHDKVRAARRWCEYANAHAREHGDKPWRYLLLPHDAIHLGATVAGLERTWTSPQV